MLFKGIGAAITAFPLTSLLIGTIAAGFTANKLQTFPFNVNKNKRDNELLGMPKGLFNGGGVKGLFTGPGSPEWKSYEEREKIDEADKPKGLFNGGGFKGLFTGPGSPEWDAYEKRKEERAIKNGLIERPEPEPETKLPEEPHVAPTYTTSFGSLESLWQNMNKLVTETVATDYAAASASTLAEIYKWITGVNLSKNASG